MNSATWHSAPYRITRTPLTVVDRRLVSRLPQDSRPRMVFDRVLGSLDELAGRLLADDALAARGSQRVSKIDKLAIATDLERTAAERRGAAAEAKAQGEDKAATKAQQARDRADAGKAEAVKVEREAKQAASAKARSIAAQKKKQAEARKQERVSAIEDGLEKVDAVTTARTTAAQRAAKTSLSAAARTRAAADAERKDADQLDELVTVKRRTRKQD